MSDPAELLASAVQILNGESSTFEVKPWREIMPKLQADARKKEMKRVEARIGKPPKHVPRKEGPTDGVDKTDGPGVQSGFSVFSQSTPHMESVMSKQEVKQDKVKAEKVKVDAEAKAAAQAEREAKRAEKAAAAAKAKEEKEKAKLAREQEKLQKLQEKEARKAEREAKRAERGAVPTAPMAALRDARARYVTSMTGRLRSTDALAEALDAVPPENVIKLAMMALDLPANPYAALNIGQQSMNLRNKLRHALKQGKLTVEHIATLRDDNSLAMSAEAIQARTDRRAKHAARQAAAA